MRCAGVQDGSYLGSSFAAVWVFKYLQLSQLFNGFDELRLRGGSGIKDPRHLATVGSPDEGRRNGTQLIERYASPTVTILDTD